MPAFRHLHARQNKKCLFLPKACRWSPAPCPHLAGTSLPWRRLPVPHRQVDRRADLPNPCQRERSRPPIPERVEAWAEAGAGTEAEAEVLGDPEVALGDPRHHENLESLSIKGKAGGKNGSLILPAGMCSFLWVQSLTFNTFTLTLKYFPYDYICASGSDVTSQKEFGLRKESGTVYSR